MADLDKTIGRLSTESRAMEPLPRPWHRVVRWLSVSVPYMVVAVLVAGLRPDLFEKLGDARFLIEQGAALVTAVTAGLAAFYAVIPGRSHWTFYLPVPSLVVWLGSLGTACIAELSMGAHTAFTNDWMCLPAIMLIGALPALAMALMVRKGAPIFPHLSVTLGGLAAAALGDFGLRLAHPVDAGLMVLVWQFGSVAVLAIAAWLIGPRIAHWRRSGKAPT